MENKKIRSLFDGIIAFEVLKNWTVCFKTDEEIKNHRKMCDQNIEKLRNQLSIALEF